jgi:hypothetical protein
MWKSGCQVRTRTLLKTCRIKFPHIPYNVTNYKENYNYPLKFILIFSPYTISVRLKDKSCTSITPALKSLFQNRKPFTTRSDKVIEFVNAVLQQYLKREGVNFHTTHNPDIKGSVIERFNKSFKTRMYKYFTKNITFRYLDVINKLLRVCNYYTHSTISMQPSKDITMSCKE